VLRDAREHGRRVRPEFNIRVKDDQVQPGVASLLHRELNHGPERGGHSKYQGAG